LFAAAVVCFLLLFCGDTVRRSLYEQRQDFWLHSEPRIGFTFDIVFDSFDPDALTLRVHATPSLEVLGIAASDLATKLEGLPTHYFFPGEEQDFRFGPISLIDWSEYYSLAGLALIQANDPVHSGELLPKHHTSYSPGSESTVLPPAVESQFKVLGDSALYPFDRYLAVGAATGELAVVFKSQRSRILNQGGRNIDVRTPGYIAHEATAQEMNSWPTFLRGQRMQWPNKQDTYVRDKWIKNRFAVILERPTYLKRLSLLLLMICLVAAVATSLTVERSNWPTKVGAFFLAIWAIRSVLATGAPRYPSLIDFAALAIFVLTAVIVTVRFIWSSPPQTDRRSPVQPARPRSEESDDQDRGETSRHPTDSAI